MANVFETFRKMCLKIYYLDSVESLSAPELAWQQALKRTEIELLFENRIRIINWYWYPINGWKMN